MDKYFKLIEETTFIDWVFIPTPELNQYWKQYIKENPEEQEIILKLKDALYTFKSKQQYLNSSQKGALLYRMQQSITAKSKKQKAHKFYIQSLKYAAVAFLFFIAGTLLNNEYNKKNKWADVNYPNMPEASTSTLLQLPNGRLIELEEFDSKIQHTKTGNIIVNNDTINITENLQQPFELIHIKVPYGNKARYTLPDGSVAIINAGSQFIYPSYFEGKKREVMLIGEAFFEITKNEQLPFIVRTPKVSIKVLGTQFNLSAYPLDKTVETVLTEGSVRIHHINKSLFEKDIILVPGQMASYNNETGISKVVAVDIEDHILWKDGLLKFTNYDLNRITKKLERYYNINIKFENPLTGMIVITGKLDLNTNMDNVLENLATTASSKIYKLNERNYIIM